MEYHLEILHRDIEVDNLQGLYSEHPCPAGLAVKRGLSHEEEEALELEAESYLETGLSGRWGGREFFYKPDRYENMSRRRINNLRKTIEKKRPEWVEAIRQAAKASNNLYVIIGLAGLEQYPYAAVAIIENLLERGELPEAED
ncbi:MAG: hypothetical protein K6T51_01415 [Rubrobacteraceae bacterium]|nr:hypothetical protein [Rubrobacteraceae bacterium]